MKARTLIAAVLLLGLLAGMPVARGEAITHLSAGVAAAARWTTDVKEAFVGVTNGQAEEQQLPADLYAYISIYEMRWSRGIPMQVPQPVAGSHPYPGRPMGCSTEVKLEAGQFTFDPMLEQAAVNIPETECGPVRVTWVQSGPLTPGYGAGASPSLDWGAVGGGAGVSRPAVATGSIEKTRLTEEALDGAGMSAGAGAYAIFFGESVMARMSAFRAVGAKFRSGSTTATLYAAEALESEVSGGGLWHGLGGSYACVFMRSTTRVNGRTRHMGEGGCGIVRFELDPALQTARIAGRLGGITVDVSFTGVGDLIPENESEQALPSGPEDVLEPVYVDSQVYLSRVATTTGRISSRRTRISLSATRPTHSLLCEGVHATVRRGHSYDAYFDEG